MSLISSFEKTSQKIGKYIQHLNNSSISQNFSSFPYIFIQNKCEFLNRNRYKINKATTLQTPQKNSSILSTNDSMLNYNQTEKQVRSQTLKQYTSNET